MNPIELNKTIYLGDRSIKGINIDAWERVLKIQIDLISRIRSSDGLWNYYADEDIENGFLVFTGVYSFEIQPVGALPHDFITAFNIFKESSADFDGYKFEIGSADLEGRIKGAAKIVIYAKDFYLEDPRCEGKKIST